MTGDGQAQEILAAIEKLLAEVRQLAMAVPEQLVDIEEAARHLKVSTRTVKRWVAADLIPYRRVGRKLRFPLAKLNVRPRDGSPRGRRRAS